MYCQYEPTSLIPRSTEQLCMDKRTDEILKYVVKDSHAKRGRTRSLWKGTVRIDEQLVEDLCPHISWEREIRTLIHTTRFRSSRIRSSMYNNITAGLRVGIYEDVFRSDYTKFWVFRKPVENCAHIQKCRIKVPLSRLIFLRDRSPNRHLRSNRSVVLRVENLFRNGPIRVFGRI